MLIVLLPDHAGSLNFRTIFQSDDVNSTFQITHINFFSIEDFIFVQEERSRKVENADARWLSKMTDDNLAGSRVWVKAELCNRFAGDATGGAIAPHFILDVGGYRHTAGEGKFAGITDGGAHGLPCDGCLKFSTFDMRHL